jgi:hypothetical protein
MWGFVNDDSRVSPLCAGHTVLGLTEVVDRCDNAALLSAMPRRQE